MRFAGPASIAALALALAIPMPGDAPKAAQQGERDAKYDIAVPKRQRKVGVGDTKDYADGDLEVTLHAVERTSVLISVNDEDPFLMESSVITLYGVDDETICRLAYLGKIGKRAIVAAECEEANDALRAALEAQESAEKVAAVDPFELIEATETGGLTNPYTEVTPLLIAEGRQLYLANSCNGCHGGTGGGGMGPPLTNPVWVYGDDDDTLFRLIILGSDELQAAGYSRVAREQVVGPMPPFEGIIESDDKLWKIIAFIKSLGGVDTQTAGASGE